MESIDRIKSKAKASGLAFEAVESVPDNAEGALRHNRAVNTKLA